MALSRSEPSYVIDLLHDVHAVEPHQRIGYMRSTCIMFSTASRAEVVHVPISVAIFARFIIPSLTPT